MSEDSAMREVGAETIPTEQTQETPVTQETVEGEVSQETQESQTEETVSDDADYLSQFEGLPDDVKSVDDIIREYVELKKGKSTAPVEELKPALAPLPVQQEQKRERLIPENPVSNSISRAIESGLIDEVNAPAYKALGGLFDRAITPVFDDMTKIMGIMAQRMQVLEQGNRISQWNALPDEIKGTVKKDTLDQIMDQQGLMSYEQALMYYAIHRDPKVITKFGQVQRNEGERQGRNKQFKKFSQVRRGNPQQGFTPKYNYGDLVDSEGNLSTQKILAKYGNDYNKVVEIKKAYAADFEKEHSSQKVK